MCTLIVARNVFPRFPFVAMNNRDELLDRPSRTPLIRDTEFGILAPKDLQRGGSWIGINKFGIFVGLTNRLNVKSKRGRMSRGELVMRALRSYSADHAYNRIKKIGGSELNGFNLVIADTKAMFLLRGDGKEIVFSEEGDGLIVVSNHGVGRPGERDVPRRVANVLRVWDEQHIAEQTPTPPILMPLLAIHDESRYGTCIQDPEHNYGTKSSGIIRLNAPLLGAQWRYWHRERMSLDREICLEQFAPVMTLPVMTP